MLLLRLSGSMETLHFRLKFSCERFYKIVTTYQIIVQLLHFFFNHFLLSRYSDLRWISPFEVRNVLYSEQGINEDKNVRMGVVEHFVKFTVKRFTGIHGSHAV